MSQSPSAPAAGVRLSRATGHGRPAAPVRMLHLGVGNFFRAHQAWYTDRAPDAAEWGIAAFTGRSAAIAELLAPQHGLYTLLTQAGDGDTVDVVSSLSEVRAANEHGAWLDHWRAPTLGVVTLTVTEAGYLRDATGRLDVAHADVRADIAALRREPLAPVRTVPARLVAGLLARRAAHAGPMTVLPCDNLPDNGPALRQVVADMADAVHPTLERWIEDTVAFGTSVVDRITPATTAEHRATVLAATGLVDASPVPTEPFSEWVMAGEFPAARPAWEAAGALVVDDVRSYEQRKLWLLNGSHSLMAYGATLFTHETVADAIADPVVRGWVEEWWQEACTHLPLPDAELAEYRCALLDRYANPRLRHGLAQIAADGSQKLPVRIVPTLRAERAARRVPPGAVRAIAAWVLHVRGHGAPVNDVQADLVSRLGRGTLEDTAAAVLRFLGEDLGQDRELREAVLGAARDLAEQAQRRR